MIKSKHGQKKSKNSSKDNSLNNIFRRTKPFMEDELYKDYKILGQKKKKENNFIIKETLKRNDKINKLIFMVLSFFVLIVISMVILIAINIYNYYNNRDINEFVNLFPKIITNKGSPFINLNINISEILNSRKLYINYINITREYIHYIFPRNKTKEKKHKKNILFPNLTFDNFPTKTRKNQIKPENFYDICRKGKLLDTKKYNLSENPLISIILPLKYNINEFPKSIRSIQNQSFKNIEIIIVDDCSKNDTKKILDVLFEEEPRIRIFTHLKKMGIWRSRLDGFLYSKGKYILHFNPGDIYADNYVLEDIYNLITKYKLDTVRFAFSDIIKNGKNLTFEKMKKYPKKLTKIFYGKPNYNVNAFGYGTIWNILIRRDIMAKGLYLVDEYILNAYKNLWDDIWWNTLINKVSFSNLIVNRLGYIYLYHRKREDIPNIKNKFLRDKAIREFIYFWLFDLELLPRNNNKKKVIDMLRHYSRKNHTYNKIPMRLDFLRTDFPIYNLLLTLLIKDPYVSKVDKHFVRELYKNSTKISKKNKNYKRIIFRKMP